MTNNQISPENKNIMDAGLAIVWNLIIVGTLAWMFLLCTRVLPEVREARRSANAHVENAENIRLEEPTSSRRVSI